MRRSILPVRERAYDFPRGAQPGEVDFALEGREVIMTSGPHVAVYDLDTGRARASHP